MNGKKRRRNQRKPPGLTLEILSRIDGLARAPAGRFTSRPLTLTALSIQPQS